MNGLGYKRNLEKAFGFFEKSALQGCELGV